MHRDDIMKRMTGLWRSCLTALLLWCAWPALAAELPLSLADAKGRRR
jgi:thiosulfate/3-mercaptopyruvate sulfurtransferase